MTQLPRPLLLYLVGRQADEARATPEPLEFANGAIGIDVRSFTFPCCGPATGLIRAYSDGGPVIATGDPKTDESIAEGPTIGKKPRKGRSDAGKSRPVKKDGSPRKPRTPSTKPRKKRSDAGVPKGLSKKVYEEVLHGARPVIATGGPETGGEQPQTDESITKPHEGSDAGVSRVVKNNEDAPKPRTPSTKPRKRRSDAGILKGPLKKVFEDVLHGARAAIPEGEAETDSGATKRPKANLSRISFGKRGDRARQNIISGELCDDIIQRLAPSLEKHKGCDIIDINPGVGLWSSKLHDIVKPRTHILMEPDASTYEPYLEPLVNQKDSTYKFLKKSGIIWNNLNKLESDGHLPHQKLYPPGDPELEKPNNTLLVTANLGYWPRRSYIGFPSITTLVIHQLLTATRAHSIFQGYGQIRMLIWMHDHEKRIVLPRLITNRRKSSIETEISCEYIHEVAGRDVDAETFRREQAIDILSCQRVAPAMAAAGLHTPPHREGTLEREAREAQLDASSAPTIGVHRPYKDELADLEERYARGVFPKYYDQVEAHHKATPEVLDELSRRQTEEFARMQSLRWRLKSMGVVDGIIGTRLDTYEALEAEWVALRASSDPDREAGMARVEERIREWRRSLESTPRTASVAVNQRLEERRGYRASPAVLAWDRRAMEPLIVKASEFAPAQPMALLDFQPRIYHRGAVCDAEAECGFWAEGAGAGGGGVDHSAVSVV
ncbi:hypothetical protein V493_03454 [Pseudogymnoascus sp. VKM F-4281 (FW-2241)]|nr:hypothetical protein V493_03454 [Pseudogymnoascus sp. VKM F-4281 (FW-2241)]